MESNETMVEQQVAEAGTDDASQESLAEEQDTSETLESFLTEEPTEDASEPAEESDRNDSQGTSEPGWIKKRVQEAVDKQVGRAVQQAVQETEARMRAEFAKELAPFKERELENEAKELVRRRVVQDLEVAKELVRYRQGLPQQPQPQQEAEAQPRNEQGQFAPKRDPAVAARVDMLAHQAESIKKRTGMDVTEVFTKDEDIKRKVISGEMDFYDVAEMQQQKQQRKKTPAPMRSPNGASGDQKSTIASMSSDQFRRFEKSLKEGKRYAIK